MLMQRQTDTYMLCCDLEIHEILFPTFHPHWKLSLWANLEVLHLDVKISDYRLEGGKLDE